MNSPANSRPDAFDVALIGLSTRALARSARRAGLRALSFDLFADADTREHAAKTVRVDGRTRGMGLDPKALLAALAAHAPAGLPVVFGAGFEDATGGMTEVARRHPIRGATPETVAWLKDPFALAALLARLSIRHPEIADGRDATARGLWRSDLWLSKRVGASGGAHVRMGRGRGPGPRYAQRRVDGVPVSALFLADGRRARLIGFSAQWADPTRTAPFRYGGAVGPIDLPEERRAAIVTALDRIVAATGLLGLASADMLMSAEDGAAFTLLEINPRPGATLDLFDRGGAPSLLAAHLAASEGRSSPPWPVIAAAQAAATVYAPHRTSIDGVDRPSWTADWPANGDMISPGAPVCTVLASAASPEAAHALVLQRCGALLHSLSPAYRATAVLSSKAMAST